MNLLKMVTMLHKSGVASDIVAANGVVNHSSFFNHNVWTASFQNYVKIIFRPILVYLGPYMES